MALALTLLTGAGLLLKSFARLQEVDPGFDPTSLLTFNLALPQTRYPSDTAADRLLRPGPSGDRARSPACIAAGGTSVMPFGGAGPPASFEIEGYQPPPRTSRAPGATSGS